MSRWCGKRSPGMGCARSPGSGSSDPRRCGSEESSEMPPDTGAINDKAPAEASPAPTARFEVPEFLVPKSLAEVRELARLLALAEWAPDGYRDPEGIYVPQKIELAIMHG